MACQGIHDLQGTWRDLPEQAAAFTVHSWQEVGRTDRISVEGQGEYP